MHSEIDFDAELQRAVRRVMVETGEQADADGEAHVLDPGRMIKNGTCAMLVEIPEQSCRYRGMSAVPQPLDRAVTFERQRSALRKTVRKLRGVSEVPLVVALSKRAHGHGNRRGEPAPG